MIRILQSAWADIHSALRLRSVWIALASEDISDQHKRTSLGPLWLLINYLAFAFTFIVIFQRGQGIPNYPAYIALGLFVWFFISEIISLSATLFTREEGFLKGTTLPIFVYALRLLMQSIIRMGFTLVGCISILIISNTGISSGAFAALPGIMIVLLTAPAVVITIAFLGAYFPDSQYIVSNIMRIGMFVTPIFWHPDNSSGARRMLYDWNPFTYFIEMVRIPVLDGEIPLFAFGICSLFSISFWILALLLLGTFRKKVIFVL